MHRERKCLKNKGIHPIATNNTFTCTNIHIFALEKHSSSLGDVYFPKSVVFFTKAAIYSIGTKGFQLK